MRGPQFTIEFSLLAGDVFLDNNRAMSAVAEKLKSELSGLPADERARLAHFLIQSLPSPSTISEKEFDEELSNRGYEIREGKAMGEPVEKVISELRQKFQ
jgi:putative addiction module component (TIGR02574 family)